VAEQTLVAQVYGQAESNRYPGVPVQMSNMVNAAGKLMQSELSAVLQQYDLGELKGAWRPKQGFVNDNWVVETTQGSYFLKHRHPSRSQPELIRFVHALMAWLERAGFPAPRLLQHVYGNTLLVLDGECYEVQEYIAGRPYDHSRAQDLQEAAITLGRYHVLVEGFWQPALCKMSNLYHPTILRSHLASLVGAWQLDRNSEFMDVVSEVAAHSDDLAARFACHGTLPELVIHGDYYAGNLLFDGDRVVAVVDYDKACWQPRVVELAEVLVYFASPRPGYTQHLIYPGALQWGPFKRYLRAYSRVAAPSDSELRALPDYIQCIWLQISLQRLWEKGKRPPWALEALHEVRDLGDWAKANASRIIDVSYAAIKEQS
jgi:Ser/Thr protein kinase RdoA (MazF antagonist)